jgi:hypothetical protein
VIATELRNALERGATGEHGDDREAQDGREVVDFPFAFARIENAVEHLSE